MRYINLIGMKWCQFLKTMALDLATISGFLKFSSLRQTPRSIECSRFIFRTKARWIYSSQTMSISRSNKGILRSQLLIQRLSRPMNVSGTYWSSPNKSRQWIANVADEHLPLVDLRVYSLKGVDCKLLYETRLKGKPNKLDAGDAWQRAWSATLGFK